jgi:hypothetical protein
MEYGYNSPFEEIREGFLKLIKELENESKEFETEFKKSKEKLYRIPSIFIDEKNLIKINENKDKNLMNIFQKEFLNNGIVSNLTQILGNFY